MDLDSRLQILLKHLASLRLEGVSSLEIDGIKVTLRPPDVAPPELPQEAVNPRDPVMYGLDPKTKLPRLGGR